MEVLARADLIRKELKQKNHRVENPIDLNLSVIPPFRGSNEIKLFIIGQDPTIKNVKTRDRIKCTLNLDKGNALHTYINNICQQLGISIENVYASNLFKYFYTIPPAQTMDVVEEHLAPNMELLQEELAQFPNATVIALGEPLLQLLVNRKSKVRNYWDYDVKTKITNGNFTFSKASENKLERDFFPFPHQPSLRKEFYKGNLDRYLRFVGSLMGEECK